MRLARVALTGLTALTACSREPPRLGVGSAAVLRRAMPELVATYRARTGTSVDVVYGSSDTVAAHANLDVLVLADSTAFPTGTTPRAIATTQLVLVGAAGSPHRFATLDASTVVAIGDPLRVPVGRYARQHLQQLGTWDAVSSRAVLGGDVAGVLALAQRGTAHVAIVYATDASDAAPLVVLDRAEGGPTVEIAAATASSARRRDGGDAFVQFLASPDAARILQQHEFQPP